VPDAYDDIDMWWRPEFASAQEHLFSTLGIEVSDASQVGTSVGDGWLLFTAKAPWQFAESKAGADELRGLVRRACGLSGKTYREATCWEMRRGRYRIVVPLSHTTHVKGPFVDLFDPEMPWLPGKELPVGQAGLFYEPMGPLGAEPQLLFSSGRMRKNRQSKDVWQLTLAGPLETDGRVRIHLGDRKITTVTATTPTGDDLLRRWEVDPKTKTAVVAFGFCPAGTAVEIAWD
jgi:hypothetical protein